jgi:hypothetical protein
MKNLIISILSAILITGMDFWEFDKASDRPLITAAIVLVIFIIITSFESWLKDRRLKRIRVRRFARKVSEMKNRP